MYANSLEVGQRLVVPNISEGRLDHRPVCLVEELDKCSIDLLHLASVEMDDSISTEIVDFSEQVGSIDVELFTLGDVTPKLSLEFVFQTRRSFQSTLYRVHQR